MPLWAWLLVAAVGLLILLVLYGLGLVVRRRTISHNGGAFELSLRPSGSAQDRGWTLGLGRYSGDHLEYFRIFSLALRPQQSWARHDLSYSQQREPSEAEAAALYRDQVIVDCRARDDQFQLAMGRESLMGLQSWLEARPPGADWNTPRVR